MDDTQLIEDSITVPVTTTIETSKTIASKLDNKKSNLSKYCLRLVKQQHGNNEQTQKLIPLMIGKNLVGRSKQSDLCILDKSISKDHAIIELTMRDDLLLKCSITDANSTNKIKLLGGDETIVLERNETQELNVNDHIQLGSVRFQFTKMNESEQKEQELERVKVLYICDEVDCDGDTPVIKKTVAVTTAAAAATNGDSNGSSKKMNETGKLRNLFEIENTLNDTCLIDEEKKNGDGDSARLNGSTGKNGVEHRNGSGGGGKEINHKLFIADTDPEDGESSDEEDVTANNAKSMNSSAGEFHLEMSHSVVNQSVVSSKSLHASMQIPDTMISDCDMDQSRDEGKEKPQQVADSSAARKNMPVEEKKKEEPTPETKIESSKSEVSSKFEPVGDTQLVDDDDDAPASPSIIKPRQTPSHHIVQDTLPAATTNQDARLVVIDTQDVCEIPQAKGLQDKLIAEKPKRVEIKMSQEEDVVKTVKESETTTKVAEKDTSEGKKDEETTETAVITDTVEIKKIDEVVSTNTTTKLVETTTLEAEKTELVVAKPVEVEKPETVDVQVTTITTTSSTNAEMKPPLPPVSPKAAQSAIKSSSSHTASHADDESIIISDDDDDVAPKTTPVVIETEKEKSTMKAPREPVTKMPAASKQLKANAAAAAALVATGGEDEVRVDTTILDMSQVCTDSRPSSFYRKEDTLDESQLVIEEDDVPKVAEVSNISVGESKRKGRSKNVTAAVSVDAAQEKETTNKTEEPKSSRRSTRSAIMPLPTSASSETTTPSASSRTRNNRTVTKNAPSKNNEEDLDTSNAETTTKVNDASVQETNAQETTPAPESSTVTESSTKIPEIDKKKATVAPKSTSKGKRKSSELEQPIIDETTTTAAVAHTEQEPAKKSRGRLATEILTEIVANPEATSSSTTISTEPDTTNINNADEITTNVSTTEAETTTTKKPTTTRRNARRSDIMPPPAAIPEPATASASSIQRRSSLRVRPTLAAPPPVVKPTTSTTTPVKPSSSRQKKTVEEAPAKEEEKETVAEAVADETAATAKAKLTRQRRSVAKTDVVVVAPEVVAPTKPKRGSKDEAVEEEGDEADQEDNNNESKTEVKKRRLSTRKKPEEETVAAEKPTTSRGRKSVTNNTSLVVGSSEAKSSKQANESLVAEREQVNNTSNVVENKPKAKRGPRRKSPTATDAVTATKNEKKTAKKVDTYLYEDSDENNVSQNEATSTVAASTSAAASADVSTTAGTVEEKKKRRKPTTATTNETAAVEKKEQPKEAPQTKRGRKGKNNVTLNETTETSAAEEEGNGNKRVARKRKSSANTAAAKQADLSSSQLDDSFGQDLKQARALNASASKAAPKSKNSKAAATTSAAATSSPGTPQTTKLFFHSKRRKTPQSSATSANESSFVNATTSGGTSNQRYSSLINTTPRHAKVSASNQSANTSGLGNNSSLGSPNKKFKLHKAKSSSSENLNSNKSGRHLETSSDDDSDDQIETLANIKKRKQVTINPVVVTSNLTTQAVLSALVDDVETKSPKAKSPKAKSPKVKSPKVTNIAAATTSAAAVSTEEVSTESVPAPAPTVSTKTMPAKKSSAAASKKRTSTSPVNQSLTTEKKPTRVSRMSLSTSVTTAPTRNSTRNKGTPQPMIMTTGFVLTDKEKQIISNLGGQIVTDVKECTHLITKNIIKTTKFLSCVNRGVHILHHRWIEQSNKSKLFISPATHALVDTPNEKLYKFTLQSSLNKAKKSPLLNEWKFIIVHTNAPNDEITADDVKCIIECGSGEVIEQLPTNEDELASCCIIYKDMDAYRKDTLHAQNKSVLKMVEDTFFNCVLKQSLDVEHNIDETPSN